MEKGTNTTVYFGEYEVFPNEISPEDAVLKAVIDGEAKTHGQDREIKIDYVCVTEPEIYGADSTPDTDHGVRASYTWMAYPIDKSTGKIDPEAKPINLGFEPSDNNRFRSIAESIDELQKANKNKDKGGEVEHSDKDGDEASSKHTVVVTDRRFLDQYR